MGTLLRGVPEEVRIVEVSPRDGLQNEPAILATADKARLITLLAASRPAEIEVTSFVSPARVPQLADAAQLFDLIDQAPGILYSALVPNERGLERAITSGVRAVSLFTSASETFNSRNIGVTIEESLQVFARMVPPARAAGMRVRAYVSTAWVCPFEGKIDPAAVTTIAIRLYELGVDEISLGDTIGRAAPREVEALLALAIQSIPVKRLACHFHDTCGYALANVLMSLQCGISTFDSSAGGVGGCPFAPGAAGNLATEDLVGMLEAMKIRTGVDLASVEAATRFLSERLGRPLSRKQTAAARADQKETSI